MYDLAHPITGTPAPGVMKFTILVRGFLDHYYYIFTLSARCTGDTNFTLLPKI